MNDLYKAALQANKDNTLTQWLVSYLNESGRNKILAEGLSEDGQFHTGLIDFPIDKLKILMGPDETFRYYEDSEKFESRVEAMADSLKQGWKPVPFIASKDLWNKGLELNDGAHRAEALKRSGITTYLTVIYFKTQQELDTFTKSLG